MTKLALPPAHATVLPGAPAQPNTSLPIAPSQRDLAAPVVNIPPPVQGAPITRGHLPLNNMQLSGWTAELLAQSKKLELKLLNAKIKKDKILLNLEKNNCELNKRLHEALLSNHPLPNSNRTDHNIHWVMLQPFSDCIKKKATFMQPYPS